VVHGMQRQTGVPCAGAAATTLQDLPMNAVAKVIAVLAASYTSYLPQCAKLPSIARSTVSGQYLP